MTWAVGEQTVPFEDHLHVSGLQFSSEDSSAQTCSLTLHCEDGSSVVLDFARGGALVGTHKVLAPTPPAKEAKTQSASSKKDK